MMCDSKTAFDRIFKRSAELGMNLRGMCQIAGVDPQKVSGLQEGYSQLSIAEMHQISRVLGCTVGDILDAPEPTWQERIIAEMREKQITLNDLCCAMDLHPAFVRAVLDGKQEFPYGEKRFGSAIHRVLAARGQEEAYRHEEPETKATATPPTKKKEDNSMNCLTMTLKECSDELRKIGANVSAMALSNGIEQGVFPFGHVVSVGASGRRTITIFKKDFHDWVESKREA